MAQQSARAQIIERRTYLRPLDRNGTIFETPMAAWKRVIDHQRWLWERAQNAPLEDHQEAELDELLALFLDRKVTVSGRTRWLGGTDIAKEREASQFNCSFSTVQTVHDVVDTIWLLLQGCGVGFGSNIGVLNGFTKKIDELVVIRSKKVLPRDEDGNPISDPSLKGCPENREWFDRETGDWHITVGDSAVAWAKFFGKLLAFKGRARRLIVDLSEIRPAGYRLSGYGWISSGDTQIAGAVEGIFEVMNRAAGRLLDAMDLLDIENHLGTILSSRRSAEIALYPFGGPEWEDFATAKRDNTAHFVRGGDALVFDMPALDGDILDILPADSPVYIDRDKDAGWEPIVCGDFYRIYGGRGYVLKQALRQDRKHRAMSNNSLLFWQKPSRADLQTVFDMIIAAGGSEPGFINAEAATRRAPYFKGVNPCAEILLGDKSFCNLVESALSRFNGRWLDLLRAHYLVARANYRQTCVDLRDGVLQETWHQLNEFLRLCGVGVTAVTGWEFAEDAAAWRELRAVALDGANAMADELGTPRPKLVTTVKPSGTQSKVFGCVGDEVGEGVHKPLGKYIFNNVNFSRSDPMVSALLDAGYLVFQNPTDESGVVVRIPVEYSTIPFDEAEMVIRGRKVTVPVNLESAVSQLERYRLLMENYVDHNCSITVSYSQDEIPAMLDWFMEHWDIYVGVSFIYRNDPTKTAADLGYSYLPQEVVDEETFRAYADTLLPVNFDGTDAEDLLDLDDCASGACPIR